MNIYKIGKIISFGKNYFILESNYQGYLVYAAKLERFEKEIVNKIFVYSYENNFTKTLYGFKTFKERLLFIDLLTINGVGPKTALAVLQSGYYEAMNLIAAGDFETLSSFPFLGLKNSKQIIFEYQDKYLKLLEKDKNKDKSPSYQSKTKKLNELSNVLKTLGFKTKQINYAISNITQGDDVEQMIEDSIKLIADEKTQIPTTS